MIEITTEQIALGIRKKILTLTHHAKSSHVGGALSITDILAVLYHTYLQYDSKHPDWCDRDRLLYSKGHASTALYATLEKFGFLNAFDLQKVFTQNGSIFTSHVSHLVPGIEFSTGSLGHALPIACGMAIAAKRKEQSWRTFVILSDGELDEGSNWEAILFAGHHKLNNLTAIIDYNQIQSFGKVSEVLELEPLGKKFEAFGWDTCEIDGHDHDAIKTTISRAPNKAEKPIAIIARTIKGKGVSFMENQLSWHYKSPSEEELQRAFKELDSKN